MVDCEAALARKRKYHVARDAAVETGDCPLNRRHTAINTGIDTVTSQGKQRGHVEAVGIHPTRSTHHDRVGRECASRGIAAGRRQGESAAS